MIESQPAGVAVEVDRRTAVVDAYAQQARLGVHESAQAIARSAISSLIAALATRLFSTGTLRRTGTSSVPVGSLKYSVSGFTTTATAGDVAVGAGAWVGGTLVAGTRVAGTRVTGTLVAGTLVAGTRVAGAAVGAFVGMRVCAIVGWVVGARVGSNKIGAPVGLVGGRGLRRICRQIGRCFAAGW